MKLPQWHTICNLGEDELQRPPVVALTDPNSFIILGPAMNQSNKINQAEAGTN